MDLGEGKIEKNSKTHWFKFVNICGRVLDVFGWI